MTRLRATFYVLSVLSEDKITQTEGMVWVSCLMSPRVASGFNHRAAVALTEVLMRMPIRVKALHFVVVLPKTAKKEEVDGMADKIRAVMMGNEFSAQYTGMMLFHKRNSVEEISNVLKAFGLSPESLPKSCGGSWKYEGTMKFCCLAALTQKRVIFSTLFCVSLSGRICQVAKTTQPVRANGS